jgi:hypothetical protein
MWMGPAFNRKRRPGCIRELTLAITEQHGYGFHSMIRHCNIKAAVAIEISGREVVWFLTGREW